MPGAIEKRGDGDNSSGVIQRHGGNVRKSYRAGIVGLVAAAVVGVAGVAYEAAESTKNVTCQDVSAQMLGSRAVRAVALAEVANGASIREYAFNFGDDEYVYVHTQAGTAMSTHRYADSIAPGSRMTLQVSVSGRESDGSSVSDVNNPVCRLQLVLGSVPSGVGG